MMRNKSLNKYLNISLIVPLVVGMIFCLVLFPMQTNLSLALIFPSDVTLTALNIAEIIFYYLSAVAFFVSIVFLFKTKKCYLNDKDFTKTLFLAALIFAISGALMCLSNLVFCIIVRLVSFELVYCLLGLVMTTIGVTVIMVQRQS